VAEWVLKVTDEDIDAALERAQTVPDRPNALAAEYNPQLDVVVLRLDDGRRLIIPREEMQGLENATPTQLSQIEIHAGVDIAWPQLDVDHYLPYLLEGKYATERWKQAHRKPTAA
jgi:Protein of unknown function (DUF2442)